MYHSVVAECNSKGWMQNNALINSGLPMWIMVIITTFLSAHGMIPWIINAVSGLLFRFKRTQKILRKFISSSEAMGWAVRGRQDVYIMPYNLGNHYNVLVAIPCIINAVSIAFRMVHYQ
jgi:hypothetical protein